MKIKNSRIFNYKFWIDILLPNRCPVCGKVIMWDKLLCKDCESKLMFLDNCNLKSRKWDFNELPAFDSVYSLLSYDGNAVGAIYNLKLNKGINFARYASKHLGETLKAYKIADKTDIVTCVPMSKKKKRARGYNQAEIIARFISRELEKPLESDLLVRLEDKTEQHMLTAQQRHKHVEKIYKMNPKSADITGKRILLCDDVITTGATVNKCAKLLKDMGAERVYVLTICSTQLKGITDR